MRIIRLLLIVVEIAGLCIAGIYGFGWACDPNGPYEPITFLALLIGSSLVEMIRRFLSQKSLVDNTAKLDDISAKVEALMQAAQKGHLSIAELNHQLNSLAEDPSFSSDDPMRFRLCPRCGSSNLTRTITWDRHHGMDVGEVLCSKCLWKVTGFLGKRQNRQFYEQKFPDLRQEYQ